jgi:hypothetical protein
MRPGKLHLDDDGTVQHLATEWRDRLDDRLFAFVKEWKDYTGNEQQGAQPFLQKLLEIYEVSFKPGTVFEQHPVRIPVRGKVQSQQSLFGEDGPKIAYETKRMDMYLPKVCVWEMKSPGKELTEEHHAQILGYWARMRPRYMALCNFREFWIYDTNEENGQLIPQLRLQLKDLPAHPDSLLFLRGETPNLTERAERVTADVASALGRIVRDAIDSSKQPERDRGRIARVILQCVFAMFAEDTDLIPPNLFKDTMGRALKAGNLQPLWTLFEDLSSNVDAAKKHNRLAPYMNGPLFDRDQPRIDLGKKQVENLYAAAKKFDWQDVRPEIFGTIFEQALSPVERHELGAHYTREADIVRVVGPTVIEPWRERIANLSHWTQAEALIADLKDFHVLDPACGCGDFLYVVYREMKRLEAGLAQKWNQLQWKVAKRRGDMRPPPPGPWFSIRQLHGIEIDGFAAFLARVVLWIGEHLASRELGLDDPTLPLKNLNETIRHGDALVTPWPRPEGELAIVGNPPYLGVRKMRRELGDEYVEKIFKRFPSNRAADLVTYWFSVALDTLRPGERAGFVATNSIAQNESREASLDRIVKKGGTITDAWKSYPWPGEAAVHVGVVNWIMAPWEGTRTLDGKEVASISPALTSSGDVTAARHIEANERLCFMGVTPGNKEFFLTDEQRSEILAQDPKSEAVIRPFLIGRDVNREIDQKPTRWIIDFAAMEKVEAEEFVGAMRHVRKYVYPVRRNNRREARAANWWRFAEVAPNLRTAIGGMKQVLVLSRVSPRVVVARSPAAVCFDNAVFVIALSEPFHFGVLQSALHSTWARARGSTLKGDLRYTNTTIFETFPFPQTDGSYDPRNVPQGPAAEQVSAAAESFERVRSQACKERGLGLTKIHNLLDSGEDTALTHAWVALNDAVTVCYGFPAGTWRDEGKTLARLLELNRKVAVGQHGTEGAPKTGHLFTHMLVSAKPDRARRGKAMPPNGVEQGEAPSGQPTPVAHPRRVRRAR